MAQIQGGPAIPVSVVTGGKIKGGKAIPVYGYTSPPTDGRRTAAGPARPVYVVSDAQMAAGTFQLEGGPAMPMYVAPSGLSVVGDAAQPVYVVGGSLGGATAFNPATSIANAIVGYDANLSALYQDSGRTTAASADTDPIGSLSDLIGTNHQQQATAGQRPVLKLNQRNGTLKAISFTSASSHNLVTAASVSHGVGTGDFYMFAIAKATNSGFRTIFSNGDGSPAMDISGTKLDFYWLSNGGGRDFTTALTVNNWYCLEIVRSSGTVYGYINGTLDATTISQATSMSNAVLRVGNDNLGSYYNNMIEAVWFYKTTPTTAQQTALRAYYGF